MKILFWYSDKEREYELGKAFCHGAEQYGHQCLILEKGKKLPEFDAIGMVGVKSHKMFVSCQEKTIFYFDKGYLRHKLNKRKGAWEYWRVAVNAHHPTQYITTAKHPMDRMEELGIMCWPWRKEGDHILVAGSSAKYHQFYSLFDPTRFAKKVVTEIKKRSNRDIVYRPKPTWKEAVPIVGSRFSPRYESLSELLKNCHVVVTHGSNICFESILNGIPCIVLGEGVGKPISSTRIDDIENPYLASEEERVQWLSNLAYCQWTLEEFRTGEAWETLRGQF